MMNEICVGQHQWSKWSNMENTDKRGLHLHIITLT